VPLGLGLGVGAGELELPPPPEGVKQSNSTIEQDAKEWFSLSESHGLVSDDSFAVLKMQRGLEMLAEKFAELD